MVKSSLACGLQSCLGQSWKDDPFKDFVVIVEDTDFHCHRFILSACSSFFKCMFQSELREKQDGCTTLQEMSSETFDVIINAIYSGVDGLTQDNVIDVWHATHMLDIPFLVQECEEFVCQNMSLDNYIEFFDNAKLLGSDRVINHALNFMKTNYEYFIKTETFLNASANMIITIIEDDNLNVTSENIVLESILSWVTYKKHILRKDDRSNIKAIHNDESESCHDKPYEAETFNESENVKCTNQKESADELSLAHVEDKVSKQPQYKIDTNVLVRSTTSESETKAQLVKLLTAARTTLASRDYLEKMIDHPVILSCPEAIKIIHDSLMCLWNTDATGNAVYDYRICSSSRSVMVFIAEEQIKLFSLRDGKLYALQNTSNHRFNTAWGIVASNSVFYYSRMCSETNTPYRKFVKMGDSLTSPQDVGPYMKFTYNYPFGTKVRERQDTNPHTVLAPDSKAILITFQSFIFCLCKAEKLNENHFNQFLILDLEDNPERAVVYKDNILIFYNTLQVDCYNIFSETFEQYTFDGLTSNFVSFFKGKDLFILQNNGLLRKVSKNINSKIELNVIADLWNYNIPLTGAAYFKNSLILFCKEKPTDIIPPVPGLFEDIRVITIDSDTNLTPMVVPVSWLSHSIQ